MVLRAATGALALATLLLALPIAETSNGFLTNFFGSWKEEEETTTVVSTAAQSDTGGGGSNVADVLSDSKNGQEGNGSSSDPGRSVGNTVRKSGSSGSRSRSSHGGRRHHRKSSSSKTYHVSITSKFRSGKSEHTPDIHIVRNETTDGEAAVSSTTTTTTTTTTATTTTTNSAITIDTEETTPEPSSDAQKSTTKGSGLVIPVAVPADVQNGGAPQTTLHVQMSQTEDGNIVARVDVPMSPPLVKDNSVLPATSMGRGMYLPDASSAFIPGPFPPKQNLPPFGYPGTEYNPLFRRFGPYVSPWRENENGMGSRNDWNPWNLFG